MFEIGQIVQLATDVETRYRIIEIDRKEVKGIKIQNINTNQIITVNQSQIFPIV